MPRVRAGKRRAACAAAVLFLVPAAAAAGEEKPDAGQFTLTFENDYFAATDRNYTNGVALHYVLPERWTPGAAHWLARTVYDTAPGDQVRLGFGLGHMIYTPADIAADPAPANQHPYAGHAFLRTALVIDRGDILDATTLELGMVGPGVAGKRIQNEVHDLIEDQLANGWDAQLRNEPTVNLTYERRWRHTLTDETDPFAESDIVPMASASAGNRMVAAGVGALFRIGRGLKGDYGPIRVQRSFSGGGLTRQQRDFSWYVFAGGNGRFVAHDLVLDGNTFDGSARVDREPFVAEFTAGAAIRYKSMELTYSFITSTPTFEGEQSGQRFGSISLTVNF